MISRKDAIIAFINKSFTIPNARQVVCDEIKTDSIYKVLNFLYTFVLKLCHNIGFCLWIFFAFEWEFIKNRTAIR